MRVSILDGMICAWPDCGLAVITSEDGSVPRHWLEPDQMDRAARTVSDPSPIAVEALDRHGRRHAARLP